MFSHKERDARMLVFSNTVSDLLVGLKCLDTTEVEREARRLKEQAKEYGASQVELTAFQIEQAAIAGDLDAAQMLVPELNDRLLQARESMIRPLQQPPVPRKFDHLSVKA